MGGSYRGGEGDTQTPHSHSSDANNKRSPFPPPSIQYTLARKGEEGGFPPIGIGSSSSFAALELVEEEEKEESLLLPRHSVCLSSSPPGAQRLESALPSPLFPLMKMELEYFRTFFPFPLFPNQVKIKISSMEYESKSTKEGICLSLRSGAVK